MANPGGKHGDRCFCGKESKTKGGLGKHKAKCVVYIKKALEIGEIIQCSLCDHKAKTLRRHIEKEHKDISVDQYVELYGSYMAPITREKKKRAAKQNGSWFAKLSADEKAEVRAGWIENGKKISDSIMSNPEERKRRASMLKEMWDDPDKAAIFRENQSETAKKTSARADVQAARAERLKNWRDNNPEDFYNKCTRAMHKTWTSKPEKRLRAFAQSINPLFKGNQQVNSNKHFFTNKTCRKQVDLIDKENKIIIELDGPHHFDPIFGDEILKINKKKDKELDKFCLDGGYLLIRVSHTEYDYRKSSNDFSTRTLNKVREILDAGAPGVYYLGEEYLEKNMLPKE